MKVPDSPGGEAQQMPSEANLLMALAEMHKQGRFDQPETKMAGDVIPLFGRGPTQSKDVSQDEVKYSGALAKQKLKDNPTLKAYDEFHGTKDK